MLTGYNDQGFTCTCPEGYELDDTELTCQSKLGYFSMAFQLI